MATGSGPLPRGCSTICLPFDQQLYRAVVGDPARFRQALDRFFRDRPELFPHAFAAGYRLQDIRTSAKLGLRLRRIRCTATGEAFTVRPCFALPYMVGYADAVEPPLFLRTFGVPSWALARVFGKGPLYGYRLHAGLGRHRIVGTTARKARRPAHLLADEHHQPRDGPKNYRATTVGEGCCPGCALAQTAGNDDRRAAYAVFQREADNAQPGYRPQAVRRDGWAATRQAWRALFPLVAVRRCFVHGWLNIRSRGQRSAALADLSRRVWEAFHAPDRRAFAQRRRRLGAWARGPGLTAWLRAQVEKLCGRAKGYGLAYRHPGGPRTSAMLGRLMRSMKRYFEDG